MFGVCPVRCGFVIVAAEPGFATSAATASVVVFVGPSSVSVGRASRFATARLAVPA